MKNKIDIELIKTLKPCQSRLDNAIKHYNTRSVTKAQFMGLKNITQRDKLWVAFRLMPKDNIRLAAASIAELVLNIYENRYPGDLRPRKAVEAAKSGNAAAAADAAYAAAAAYAAYAAADAAYAAAAAYAAYAAADAAAADAAADAADTAYAASAAAVYAYAAADASNKAAIEKQIRKIVLKYWE